ncbi:hypothetical protein SAMN02745223_03827 [Devosia limi DSM 17137]|uniref:Uncharacterized protein n=1 Tax=Devosia limi DSM 17137 TaxID=1121477 RepID=A0A1M5FFA3_9HYPH|nr:hypothetical protein SAMN02745223_03827 [Devosia limi DSM 17137]
MRGIGMRGIGMGEILVMKRKTPSPGPSPQGGGASGQWLANESAHASIRPLPLEGRDRVGVLRFPGTQSFVYASAPPPRPSPQGGGSGSGRSVIWGHVAGAE